MWFWCSFLKVHMISSKVIFNGISEILGFLIISFPEEVHADSFYWSVNLFDFHTTSGQKQWQKSLSVPNFVFFGKSIAEWGHGWVVHRWFENTIFDILWFWREIYESRKDHRMGYTEPFELAIWRIHSPMSQLSSGKITDSNGSSFGTLSAHFDDGLKMSNF